MRGHMLYQSSVFVSKEQRQGRTRTRTSSSSSSSSSSSLNGQQRGRLKSDESFTANLCNLRLVDSNKFIRYTCCGKGIHKWCDEGIDASSLSYEQKNSCPLCRTKYPISKEETLKIPIQMVSNYIISSKTNERSYVISKFCLCL